LIKKPLEKIFYISVSEDSVSTEPGAVDSYIFSSLSLSGLGKKILFFPYSERVQKKIDNNQDDFYFIAEELPVAVCAFKPDLIIFNIVGVLNYDPPTHIIRYITNELGYTTLLLRGDSMGVLGDGMNMAWFPSVSYIAFQDVTLSHLCYKDNPKAIQHVCCPASDSRYFFDRKLEKDIDVSFIGSLEAPRRVEYLNYLRSKGINIKVSSGRIASKEEYAIIMNRSKIVLNFCMNGCNLSQFKGRAVEALTCNSLLIEDEGIETKMFLDEGKDFIMVKSKEEMLEKIKYYLKHDDERKAIAQSGHNKVIKLYNAKYTWAYVFNKIGFELPDDITKNKDFKTLCKKLDSL